MWNSNLSLLYSLQRRMFSVVTVNIVLLDAPHKHTIATTAWFVHFSFYLRTHVCVLRRYMYFILNSIFLLKLFFLLWLLRIKVDCWLNTNSVFLGGEPRHFFFLFFKRNDVYGAMGPNEAFLYRWNRLIAKVFQKEMLNCQS